MALSCNFDAPNGSKSLLYIQLEAVLGSDEATKIWNYTRTEEFGKAYMDGWTIDKLLKQVMADLNKPYSVDEEVLARFKDLMDINYRIPTDSNGEPEFTWLAKKLNIDIKTPETKVVEKAATQITKYNETGLFGAAKAKDTRMSFQDALAKVKSIYDQARSKSDTEIDLTAISAKPLTKAGPSGFTPLELAHLFASLTIPANVHFSEEFEGLIANTASHQLQTIDFREVPMLNYDEYSLKDAAEALYVAKRSSRLPDGTPGESTGEFFTSEQQVAAIDSIVWFTWTMYNKDPEIKVGQTLGLGGSVYNMLKRLQTRYGNKVQLDRIDPNLTEEARLTRIQHLKDILNSWEDFSRRAQVKLLGMGLGSTRALSEAVEEAQDELQEEGRSLESYNDSSFELDPRDTASSRIKLFLASIQDTEVGLEREPRQIKLLFEDKDVRDRLLGQDKFRGTKTMSIRTPEQVEALGLQLGQDYIFEVEGVKMRATVDRTLTAADLEDATILGNADEEGIDVQEGDYLLKIEKWVPNPEKVQVKQNFLGLPQLVDFEDLFQELLEITSGVEPTYEAMTAAIEEEAKNFRPNLYAVVSRLKNESDQLKREFVKVMSKQYQEFSLMLHSRQRSGMLKLVEINANAGSAVRSIITQWRENQKHASMVERDANGNLIINRDLALVFGAEITELNRRIQAKDYPNVDAELKPFARRLLEANGILMPDEALDYLFKNTTKVTNNTSVSGSIHDQFTFTKDGVPKGLFSAIAAKLVGAVEEDVDEGEYLLNNNPLYTENTTMRILARLAYRYSPKTAAGSHRNSEGKSVYSFGMRTHLSTVMDGLKNDNKLRASLDSTFSGKHNWILKKLQNGEIKDEFGLRYVDGLKDSTRKEAKGITRPAMSSREQLLYTMGQFQNGGNKTANFLSLTHSDKSTTPLFTGVPKFKVKSEGLMPQVKEAVYQTFLGEYERIVAWHSQKNENGAVTTKNDSFNKGGGLYYLFPHLNYDYMLQLQKSGKISPAELQSLWVAKGIPNTKLSRSAENTVLRIFEQEYLSPEVLSLYNQMKTEGFVEGKLIDERYMKKNIANAGLVAIQLNPYETSYYTADQAPLIGKGAQALTPEQMMERMLRFAAKDMIVNYFLFHTAMTSLVFGDPALTFKPGKKSKLDYQQVEDTMKEYQKRLAKDIAPGSDPAWDNGPEELYKTLTIADDERTHPYLEHMEKYSGAAINSSDAQEVTTVREHLYIMKAQGLIEDKVYNDMLSIITAGLQSPSRYYEFTDPKHLAVVMQIMKPVAVSHNFGEVPGMSTVQYVKSSSMPLYPPLTKYFQIDELRQAMEGDGSDESHIPRANFISAKKVGAPIGKGVKIFDANGDLNIDTSSKSWNDSIQVLTRGGLRIQQEVPYEDTKAAILTGSQMNKLFTEGIDAITNFKVRGIEGEVTGADLKAMKEQTRMSMIKLQLDQFEEELGVDPTTGVVDTEKLITKLIQEAESRNYPPNDIIMLKRQVERMELDGTSFRDLAIPLFFNPSASRFESLLMSLVKKVGQVKMPGKSFIQASSAGFRFKKSMTFEDMKDSDKQGIVWVPGYDGSELKTMTKDGPAQVLMPFNFLVKNAAGEDVLANVEDYMIRDEKGRRMIDLERVPKELIEIIGFRIPTQKHNSMLPIQVVGFIPQNLGDTIIVPAAITAQMGSDFDVDKLYAYRRPYRKVEDNFVPVDTTGDVQSMNDDQLLSRYFDLAWAVLTHPDMYETVMSPLDKPDLKNEAARASVTTGIQPYFSVKRQLDDFMSQKDAKVMVGISSLSVVFTAITEDKDLEVSFMRPADEEEGETEGTKVLNGIDFIPEGEDAVSHAYRISDKGNTKYYEHDVETRMGAKGLKKVFVDPISGDIVGDFDESKGLLRTKLDDLTSLQSEFLDHAKNRTIDKLNINLQTINAALAMMSLSDTNGNKPNAKHLALFLRQPAILKLVEELSLSQDSLSTGFVPDLLNVKVQEAIEEYVKLATDLDPDIKVTLTPEGISEYLKEHQYNVIGINDLKAGIRVSGDPEWFLQQAGALLTFQHLSNIGKELGNIQKILNQDPKGPGKNMISVLDTIAKRPLVSDNGLIANAGELFDTEQGFIHRVELNTAATAFSDVLPYQGIVPIIDSIKEMTGKLRMKAEDQQEIVDQFKSYIFSDSELGLSENPTTDRFRLLYGNDNERSLATRVWEAQNTWGSNNYFLKRLQPQQADIPNTPSYVFYLASRASTLDDQENTAAFLELLLSKDEEKRRLAEDLVRYAYVTGGISGSFSFLRYIPADYLIALPFASKLRQVNATLTSAESAQVYGDFITQWIQHNPSAARKVTLEMLEKTSLAERFELPIITPEVARGALSKIIDRKGDIDEYPEYLSFYDKEEGMWKLFKRNGTREFKRVDTLGNSYINEYHLGREGLIRSIIPQNRSLIKQDFIPEIEQMVTDLPIKTMSKALKVEPKHYSPSDLSILFKKIRDDKAQPEHQRILAEVLDQITYASRDKRPITLTVEPGGLFNPGNVNSSGEITLHQGVENMDDSNFFAKVLEHETVHALYLPFTMAGTTDRAKYPEASMAYDALKQIHEEARAAVVAEIEAAGYTEADAKRWISGDGPMTTEGQKLAHLYYTVSNPNEFLASVFTKDDLQKFLNERKSKLDDNKTLLEKFLQVLAEFLQGLARDLGITIQDGSMLEVALRRSFKLLEAIDKSDMTFSSDEKVQKMIVDYISEATENSEAEMTRIAKKIEDEFDFLEAKAEKANGRWRISANYKDSYFQNFTPEADKVVTDPIEKIYGKVQEQMQEIRASIAKNKLGPGILRQRRLLTELDLLAKDLKATKDLNKIAEMAAYQLKWAQTVADQYEVQNLPVSINELMTAHRLTALWTDTLKLVYAGSNGALETDEALADVQEKATRLYDRFTGTIMKNVLKKIARTQGRELAEEDFTTLTDLPSAEAKFLSLERAKSKLVQEVALTIQNTNRAYLESGNRLVNRIADFEKRATALAKAKGLKPEALYESLFQQGTHWGLVSRYSNAFHRWKSSLRTKLTNSIDKIMEEVTDPLKRATMIKDAYASYWRSLKKKAGYIDVRVMFEADGTTKPTVGATKFYDNMVAEYGKELTDQLIEEARTKFKQYLQDKADIFSVYDQEVAEGFMTTEEAAAAKGQWDIENSPVHKLSTHETLLSTKYVNVTEKYLVLVPHKSAKDIQGNPFFDDKFEKLQGDKDVKKLYEEVKAMMDEFTSNLPYYLDNKLGPDFLPAIQKKLVTDISQVPAYVRALPSKMMDMLTASSYEEAMQSRTRKEIPIMYTEDPLKDLTRPAKDAPKEAWDAYNRDREARLKNMSKDMPRILELFGLMSLHYKHFSEAKDAIDLGKEVLQRVHNDMTGGLNQVSRNGKVITTKGGLENTLGTLQYAIDSLMYKRTKDLEGKIGDLYSKKDKEAVVARVKELKAKTEDLKKKYRNNEINKEDYEREMQGINLELDKYEVRKFYGSKIGDTLITWTQLKALSYNPLSAINNFAFGFISATVHANGKQDFTMKELFKAFSVMMNSTAKSLKLARMAGNESGMSKTARKVMTLMDRMGVMGELVDSDYGKSNVEHRKGGLKQALKPYEMMRSGDYFIKGANMVAVMMHQKVTIDGKEMSTWEAFDDDGNFKGKDFKWQSENPVDQVEFAKLRNKVIAVNKIVMGNQDRSSPMWAKKSILWRLVGQFRLSWFSEGIASRFESEREDIQLGRVRKGRYRTYADLGPVQSITMLLKQMLSALPGVNTDPYKDTRLKSGKEMSDTDKANMRRNLAELAWFLMVFGGMHLIAALADPDDDEGKKKRMRFITNMLTRTYQDVALYSNPKVFDTILGTPAPALSAIRDTQAFINASIRLATDDEYTTDQWILKLTRAGFIPQTTLYNRYRTMTEKDLATLAR